MDDNDATLFSAVPGDLARGMPKARLLCIDGEEHLKGFEIFLTNAEQTIGRDPGNSACIDSRKISRHHARVYPRNPDWMIEDLRSTNGLFVNDERVTKVALRHGDIVKLGPFSFRYLLEHAAGAMATKTVGPALDSDHTHYLGDPGVIERLVQQEEEKNIPPKPPPYVPPVIQPEPKHSPDASSRTRFIVLGSLAVLLIGGAVFLYNFLHDWKIEGNADIYTVNFRRFIDNTEGDNLQSFQALQNALVDIRKLAIRVDDTAAQYTASDCQGEFTAKTPDCKLRDLQASVLFLAFERWLKSLLEEGRVDHAAWLTEQTDDLIEKTRAREGSRIYAEFEKKLAVLLGKPSEPSNKPPEQQLYTLFNNVVVQPVPDTLPGGGRVEFAYVPTNQEVHDLLKLAKIAVEFRQFGKEFPDPNALATHLPDRWLLSNLQDKKREFVAMGKSKHPTLSGTYKYFCRLVDEVNARDTNLIDRWSTKGRTAAPYGMP